MKQHTRLFLNERAPLKIAIIYAFFSALWILLSDQILYSLVKDPEIMTKIQMGKGWLFIFFSALILFLLLRIEIRKHLQTEASLRESEKKLKAIFNHRFQLTGLLDKNGKLLMLNDVARNFVGGESIELNGKHLWQLPHWSHSEDIQREIQKAIQKAKKGKSTIFETTHVDFKGDIKHVEFSLTPVHDDQGNIIYIVPEGKDITQKKQSENQLIESERNYREIYNSSSDSICIHDLETGEIIDVNQTMLDRFGYVHQEARQLEIGDISSNEPPFNQEKAYEKIRKAVEDNPEPFEWLCKHKDGSCFWGEVALKKTQIGGKGRVLAVIRDISKRKQMDSEQKRLKSQLQQSQKMEAIGTLAGGIAHDFNNILFSILGFGEMLQDELAHESDAYKMQEKIMIAGHRAKDLVQQILLFSRQADQEIKPVQPHLIIKEALKLLKATIPATIKVKENVPTNCGSVLADPTQIHQIIMNLSTNAYHAMTDKGGVLAVSLSNVSIMEEDIFFSDLELEIGPYLRIEIADTGHGMDSATLEKIFDPYFTTKLKGEGTGLGLSVVHGIVNDMGGAVKVHSEAEKGTNFQIYLPQIDDQEDTGPNEKLTLPKGEERICIVDDEKLITEMMHLLLEKLGYSVESYTNAQDALEAFKLNPNRFDLIITDLTMPDMTGIQLIQKIFDLQADFPVILYTGFSELINKEEAEELGIKAFLTKPVLRYDLAHAIRNSLL